VTPNQMRGQVSAVYLFVVNFIGQGLGPLAVGVISDYVIRDPAEIRYALLIVVLGSGVLAAVFSWFARRPYRERIAATAQWQ
jgi:MFS family permease